MRRQMIMAAALVSGLSLAGCAGQAVMIPIPATIGGISTKDVIDKAVAVCGWETTASTVLSLFNTYPSVTSAIGFADMICAAVTSLKTSRRSARRSAPMVGRVVIRGHFVR